MPLIDADPYSKRIIGCAIDVHRTLGPGLLESVYETCLCDELANAGLGFVRQQKLPVFYKGRSLDQEFKLDIVVENTVVVEVKSIQAIHPVHEAQLHTYLKLSGLHIGLLLNFNEARLIDGLRRHLLTPDPPPPSAISAPPAAAPEAAEPRAARPAPPDLSRTTPPPAPTRSPPPRPARP